MIIVDSYNQRLQGFGTHDNIVLFADTKDEVPETGTATKAAMGGTFDLPPTTMLYTASCEVAVLDTDDTWVWREAGVTPSGNQDIETLNEYDVAEKATARVSATERAKIIPENIKKDVTILGVTGTHQGGGQPTLYAPSVTEGFNIISWENNSNNGAFGTVSATLDNVPVTSPLTVTQEMDGSELIVSVSETNFESNSTTIEVEFKTITEHSITMGGTSAVVYSTDANKFMVDGYETKYIASWNNVAGTETFQKTVTMATVSGNNFEIYFKNKSGGTNERIFMPESASTSNSWQYKTGTVEIKNITKNITVSETINGSNYVLLSNAGFSVGDEIQITINVN